MTTTTEPHPCGVRTRTGQPCQNTTTGDTCARHDPGRICGALNGRGGTCRRAAGFGRRCELHDESAVEERQADERRRHDEDEQRHAAAQAGRHAREVEADALVAALGDCVECLHVTLRAVIVVEVDPFADEDDQPATPMSVAWQHVVEHLRHGHALVTR